MITRLHFVNSAVAAFVFDPRQLRFKITCGIAALAVSIGSAAAQTTPGKTFPIRGGTQPFAITMGEDGNFWFTLSNSSKVARITPRGNITYFTTPSLSNPAFITPGPDGNLWIASAFIPQVARVTPNLAITTFPTPATPTMIRPGNANNLLFTEFSANKIASITTAGVVTESQEFHPQRPCGDHGGRRLSQLVPGFKDKPGLRDSSPALSATVRS